MRVIQPDGIGTPLEKTLEHSSSLPEHSRRCTGTFVPFTAGGTAVTILEAFKDAGAPYPKVMVGEDQEDYLQYWKANLTKAIAPTFATYQWRTAVLSAVMFLQGKTVQHHWYLPQPDVTTANLDQYINSEMPPLHYAMCGCEDMTNYPDAWKTPDTTKYVDVLP